MASYTISFRTAANLKAKRTTLPFCTDGGGLPGAPDVAPQLHILLLFLPHSTPLLSFSLWNKGAPKNMFLTL